MGLTAVKDNQKKKSTSPEEFPPSKGMDLLPKEIIIEILSRSPITSITHFKMTSSFGRDIAADQRLPTMFLDKVIDANPCLILLSHVSISSVPKQIYFLDSDDRELGFSKIARKISPSNTPNRNSKIDFVGCCNGLLCITIPMFFYSYEVRGLQIWNPFSLNSKPLDLPMLNRFMNQREVFGFGFNPRSKEFKVIRIVFYELVMTGQDGMVTLPKSEVQVLTIGTVEWRMKGASPYEFNRRPPGVLVEGSLHWDWVAREDFDFKCVISFDLEEEVFKRIPLPNDFDNYYSGYHLSEVNGCLSVAGFSSSNFLDIWVMKEYNVKESWVREYSIVHHPVEKGNQELSRYWKRQLVRVLCVMKNGEILLQFDENVLASYDPRSRRYKRLQINQLPEHFRASVFRPTLFSVKEAIGINEA